MRKEIEVKAKLINPEEVVDKLKELGCILSVPIVQHDTIFVDSNFGVFDEFHTDVNILRIRETGERFLLTLKQPKSNELDVIEHETEVQDAGEMEEILHYMGFHEVVQVHKTRSKSQYNDWEICIDEVEGLGTFIEVERIADDSNAEAIQNELFEFLKSLGIRPEDRVINGYDTLVYRKSKAQEK